MKFSESFLVTGAECAEALEKLGLELVRRSDGWSVLRRGTRLVVVPDGLDLPPSVLAMICERADLSVDDVLSALDDVPTQQDLRCLPRIA